MILPEKDAELFYRLMWPLLFYANKKYQVIKGLNSPDFRGEDKIKILKLHEKIFSHPQIIDEFVSENTFKFNEEELGIIRSWKNFVKDTFVVMSHLKEYSVFLQAYENPKAYGVVGIKSEIEEFTPFLPMMAETILLPFKGKIIYCGIINPYPVHIGSNMRRGFNADYQKAKSRFGIITSLETPVSGLKESEEELIRFYARNRAEYSEEISELLKKNPYLWKEFYQEIGKSCARKIGKRLSLLGAAPAWLAVYEDTVIASCKTEQELKARVSELVPEEKRDFVYLFRWKGKK